MSDKETMDEEGTLMELYHQFRIDGLSPKDAMAKARATLSCFQIK